MRPRLKRYAPKADENINPFKPRKGTIRKSEVQLLREGTRDTTKYVYIIQSYEGSTSLCDSNLNSFRFNPWKLNCDIA